MTAEYRRGQSFSGKGLIVSIVGLVDHAVSVMTASTCGCDQELP